MGGNWRYARQLGRPLDRTRKHHRGGHWALPGSGRAVDGAYLGCGRSLAGCKGRHAQRTAPDRAVHGSVGRSQRECRGEVRRTRCRVPVLGRAPGLLRRRFHRRARGSGTLPSRDTGARCLCGNRLGPHPGPRWVPHRFRWRRGASRWPNGHRVARAGRQGGDPSCSVDARCSDAGDVSKGARIAGRGVPGGSGRSGGHIPCGASVSGPHRWQRFPVGSGRDC